MGRPARRLDDFSRGPRDPVRGGAKESEALDFSRPDAIPESALNDILYEAIQNRNSPGPTVRFGVTGADHGRDDD